MTLDELLSLADTVEREDVERIKQRYADYNAHVHEVVQRVPGQQRETVVASGIDTDLSTPGQAGLTTLVRLKGWEELKRRFQRDVPEFLQYAGVDRTRITPKLIGHLVEELVRRCQSELGDQRVRDMLYPWVAEFALWEKLSDRPPQLTNEGLRDLLATDALRHLITDFSRRASPHAEPVFQYILDLLERNPDVEKVLQFQADDIPELEPDDVSAILERLREQWKARVNVILQEYEFA